MKGAVLKSFHSPVEIVDIGVDDPAPNEVLIRTAAAGICHTDLGIQEAAQAVTLPESRAGARC